MSATYDKLKNLLRELFQLDQADLDFGIYRILHARKTEIDDFLVRGLPPRVKAAFSQFQSVGYDDHQRELTKLVETIQAAGMDPEQSPKVKELRAKLAAQPDVARLEYETYDHLWRFFSRYYSEGDFLSKRVYRDGTYAIPYDGSEVMLHWANKDQYYIKTSEYLRDYAFRLRPDDAAWPMRVHFRLVDAQEGAHNNVKTGDDQARVFILAPGGASGRDFLAIDGDELVISFEYRVATLADGPAGAKKPPKQKDLVGSAVARLLAVAGDAALAPWIEALATLAPTEADSRRSVLAKHLDRYVKRNTFDYFIHKDLGGFLRRELDHYLKTEVMRLDDIDHADAPRVEQYLATIKVIRQIARAVIDFLAQVENFQKKLWLKKKFVTASRRLVRLDLVPETLLPQICANVTQRQAWVKMHAIDRIARSTVAEGYSEPLSPAFLRQQPGLMLDTGLFDAVFSETLCEHLGDLDALTDGVVLHSENFQALSLMQRRYAGQVECVYIDPPYNSKTSEIAYKNSYKHSSWMSLIYDRIRISATYESDKSGHIIAIDENEQHRLAEILRLTFPDRENVAVSVVHNKKGIQGDHFSTNHEFAYFSLSKSIEETRGKPIPKEEWEYTSLRKWGRESERETAKNCFYPIYVRNGAISRIGKPIADNEHPTANVICGDEIAVYPIDIKGVERKWRYSDTSVVKILPLLRVEIGENGNVQITKAVDRKPVKTIWDDSRYIAGDYGTRWLTHLGVKERDDIYPKSIHVVEDSVLTITEQHSYILDYFGGTGTTAHAVINLNRADGGKRKFILTEMADYCETVLIPRIQKVTYTPDWKDGKPERLATPEEAARGPRVVLIQRLESYEDTLNNLDLQRNQAVQTKLNEPESAAPGGFRDQYLLRYHLDLESRGSASLLNASAFLDPLAYRLSVVTPGSDERRPVTVDLIETFPWLLGLRVHSQRARQFFTAELERCEDADLPPQAPRRLEVVKGSLRQIASGTDAPWWFKPIEGTDPEGRRILVIWRNRPGGDNVEGLERDNAVLNAWVTAQGYAAKDFHRIYVNGDNQIENLRQPDQTWTVRLIDSDFAALMFAQDGV